jgi:soluble lytic murein transglycosylase
MKIKLLISILILLTILGGVFYYYYPRNYNTEFDELITENGEYEPDNAIDIIKLLLDVQKGRQQVRDEFLLKLSKNQNAIGYYSNVILANSYNIKTKMQKNFMKLH